MTNTSANNEDNTGYQDILNKYAEAVGNNPSQPDSVPLETGYDSQIAPNVLKEVQTEPVISSVPDSPLPTEETPVASTEILPPPIVENNILPPPEPPIISSTTPSSGNNIFKYIFFVSLIIFLFVASAIAYSLLKPANTAGKPITTSPTPIISETPITGATCELNDKKYTVGESFKSADGCNTCSCQEDLSIICTEMACTPTPKSSTSSSDLNKNWKTYTDKTYKYTMDYPSNWTSKSSNGSVCISSGNLKNICEINIKTSLLSKYFDNPDKLSFEELATFSLKQDNAPDSYKIVTINGLKGYAIQSSYPSYKIIFNKGDWIHEITFEDRSQPNELELQILNTFKFN